jgi:hypothetical protein
MLHRVAPAHGLLNGVKTLRVTNEPCFATIRIGVVECRALATPKLNCWCSGLLRQRTVQTEQAACLQATKVATGCTAQCIRQVLQINLRRSMLMMVYTSGMPGLLLQ